MCTEHFSWTKFCVSLIEVSQRGGSNVKALESAEVHSTRKRNRLVPSFRISNVEMLEPALEKGNKTECKAGNTVKGWFFFLEANISANISFGPEEG